jgi:hypothetical protein
VTEVKERRTKRTGTMSICRIMRFGGKSKRSK